MSCQKKKTKPRTFKTPWARRRQKPPLSLQASPLIAPVTRRPTHGSRTTTTCAGPNQQHMSFQCVSMGRPNIVCSFGRCVSSVSVHVLSSALYRCTESSTNNDRIFDARFKSVQTDAAQFKSTHEKETLHPPIR